MALEALLWEGREGGVLHLGKSFLRPLGVLKTRPRYAHQVPDPVSLADLNDHDTNPKTHLSSM